ncbi:MAG: redoxin domain-containing protein, partial [Candidatus Marinimicrobia bacterium]|nr:redoxin domain-containing protein [Candidatus Neomarinimicrobiota bacterium]
MRKIIIISFILIASILSGQIAPVISSQIYRVGDTVSDFSGTVSTEINQAISLYNYNGSENNIDNYVVWLIFFNPTSRSCQLEASYTETISEQFSNSGLITIGVGNGWREPLECKNWEETFGISYPIINDNSSDIRNMFTRGSVPHHVLINHEMEVVYTSRGYIMPPFGNDFLAVLNNSLSELSTLSLSDILIPNNSGINDCYPNPFNPSITINFELSERSFTDISVYNLLGEKVENLLLQYNLAGNHSINW